MEHAPPTKLFKKNVKCITGCQISALSITGKSEVNNFRTITCLTCVLISYHLKQKSPGVRNGVVFHRTRKGRNNDGKIAANVPYLL